MKTVTIGAMACLSILLTVCLTGCIKYPSEEELIAIIKHDIVKGNTRVDTSIGCLKANSFDHLEITEVFKGKSRIKSVPYTFQNNVSLYELYKMSRKDGDLLFVVKGRVKGEFTYEPSGVITVREANRIYKLPPVETLRENEAEIWMMVLNFDKTKWVVHIIHLEIP